MVVARTTGHRGLVDGVALRGHVWAVGMWRGLYRAADLHTTRGDLGGAYWRRIPDSFAGFVANRPVPSLTETTRSEEHTSELQSLMRISYAVFCLQKKQTINT